MLSLWYWIWRWLDSNLYCKSLTSPRIVDWPSKGHFCKPLIISFRHRQQNKCLHFALQGRIAAWSHRSQTKCLGISTANSKVDSKLVNKKDVSSMIVEVIVRTKTYSNLWILPVIAVKKLINYINSVVPMKNVSQ